MTYALDAIGNNSNDAIVVSGSRDATLLVWHWNGKQQRISGNSKPGMNEDYGNGNGLLALIQLNYNVFT